MSFIGTALPCRLVKAVEIVSDGLVSDNGFRKLTLNDTFMAFSTEKVCSKMESIIIEIEAQCSYYGCRGKKLLIRS